MHLTSLGLFYLHFLVLFLVSSTQPILFKFKNIPTIFGFTFIIMSLLVQQTCWLFLSTIIKDQNCKVTSSAIFCWNVNQIKKNSFEMWFWKDLWFSLYETLRVLGANWRIFFKFAKTQFYPKCTITVYRKCLHNLKSTWPNLARIPNALPIPSSLEIPKPPELSKLTGKLCPIMKFPWLSAYSSRHHHTTPHHTTSHHTTPHHTTPHHITSHHITPKVEKDRASFWRKLVSSKRPSSLNWIN